jgi:hypothetical protein
MMAELLFDRLRSLDLDTRDFAVFGSGPLAIRKIIPTCSDLDIICRGEVWRAVQAKGDVEYLPDYDVSVAKMYDGAISFGTCWGIGTFDIDELIDTAEMIDELPFVRLEYVVRYKTIRASDTDKNHLQALAKFARKSAPPGPV